MKKINYLSMFALTASAAMLLPSCSNDDIDIQTGDATVTLTATLPASLQTRAFGDGTTAKNLQMVVCEAGDSGIKGGNLAVFDDGTKTVYTTAFAGNSLTTNVPVKLVTGKTYAVICWSDAGAASPYTFNATDHSVDAKYEGFTTSDENLDAFYAYQTFTVEGDGTQTIQLRRPFAQLNIGTDDLAAAKAAGFTAATAEVTVSVSDHLDLVTGEVNKPKPIAFAAKALPEGETFPTSAGTSYDYLAMNYVLTGADKSLVDVNLTVTGNGAPISHTFNTVPVQRNYRTNIYGSILTNAVNVQVEIVPDFDGSYNYDATKLVRDLAAGGDITLPTDVEMRSTGFVGEGTTSTLDLNGKTIFNTNDVWENKTTINGVTEENWSLLSAKTGTLIINGDGKVEAKANDCYAADVRDGGKMIINGGHFVGNIHAVYVYEGELEVNGGTFEVIQKYPDAAKADEFVLNCYDKNREAGTAKITVKGGKFINFNPADCQAEGAHTNFVADGYASILVSESPMTYEVRPVSAESTVNDADGLTELMNKGGLAVIDAQLESMTSFMVKNSTTLVLNEGAVVSCTGARQDVSSAAAIMGTAALTIAGNGGKIVGPTIATGQQSTYAIQWGPKSLDILTIYGNVTIDGGSGSVTNNAIYLTRGTLKIYGGTFRTGVSTGTDKNSVILLKASKGNPAECYIYGGVFECEGDASCMLDIEENSKGTNTLKVYGGTFVGFNPADNGSEGEHTNFVANGYKSVKMKDGYHGKEAWQVVKQ